MAYKAVFNGDSLYHFNPFHDKKNGRFTFKKAYNALDTAVAKGYDVAEKTVRGAIKGVRDEFRKDTSPSKKEIEKPSVTSREKEAEENKKDVSEIVTRIKKENLLGTEGMQAYKDFKSKTGNYDKLKKAAVTGLKALAKTSQRDVMDDEFDDEGSAFWFLFEDQTFGMPQIADLANRGKTKEQIAKIIADCNEIGKQDPYSDMPGVWSLFEGYGGWRSGVYKDGSLNSNTEEFIDACIEAAKENRQVKHSGITQFGDYICHYNKNHSKANGQFVSGDGDGDGQIDDTHNRNKKDRYNADGHKKGVYSAKIENYHKGNVFREAYYIDKRGNKRSYTRFKDMPVEAQNAERARQKGKKIAKEVGGTAVRTAASYGLQMAARSFLGF